MIEALDRAVAPGRSYSRAELLADGVIHAVGLALALCGAAALVALCIRLDSGPTIATAAVYAASLVVALTFSAAYNMWPASRLKRLLQRCDQAAIFLLIGGTYTAFATLVVNDAASLLVFMAVWTFAVIGALFKLILPGRLDRVSLVAYLGLGWGGLTLLPKAAQLLPPTTLWLIVAGGLLYSVGVVFNMWDRLRFQNAIWHCFVLVAASCHYGAVFDCLVLARP